MAYQDPNQIITAKDILPEQQQPKQIEYQRFVDPYMGYKLPGSKDPMYSQNQMAYNRPVLTDSPQEQRNKLLQKINESTQKTSEVQKSLGINLAPMQQPQKYTGVRIGKELIAKKELDNAMKVKDKVVENYMRYANFSNQNQANIAKQLIDERLTKLSLSMAEKAAQWDAYLKEKQMSEDEQDAATQMWYQTAFTIGGAVAGSYFAPVGGGAVGAAAGAAIGGQLGGAVGQYQADGVGGGSQEDFAAWQRQRGV